MSERTRVHSAEHSKQHQERSEHSAETHQTRQEHTANQKHEHANNIDSIRKTAELEAKSTSELMPNSSETTEKEHPLAINRELKHMAFQRIIKRTQRQLGPVSRSFSKVIHQPIIESTSEVAAKTIARPSGVLSGGITAFLGSSLFLWISRHYGYEYNFLLFFLFFIGGFFLGLLIEAVVMLVKKR